MIRNSFAPILEFCDGIQPFCRGARKKGNFRNLNFSRHKKVQHCDWTNDFLWGVRFFNVQIQMCVRSIRTRTFYVWGSHLVKICSNFRTLMIQKVQNYTALLINYYWEVKLKTNPWGLPIIWTADISFFLEIQI